MRTSNRHGAAPVEMANLREALRDRRIWTGVGVVVKRPNDASHWRFAEDDGSKVDVLVEVDLHPGPVPVECRLAAAAGGPGHGLWKIPPVGTQVVVVVQGGELEADCCIVGTLASKTAPDDALLDEDTLVLVNPKNVVIKSDTGDVKIDAHGKVSIQTAGGGAQPVARKTDPVQITGGSYTASSLTLQVKVAGVAGSLAVSVASGALVVAPTGVPPIGSFTMQGTITDGSGKADCG